MRKKIIEYFEPIRILSAILLAYALALLVILIISEQPLFVIRQFMFGPFKNIRIIGNMLEFMVPIIFTGLGFSLMLQANVFNLTGDGIVYLSASITAFLATKILSGLPIILSPIILIAVGAGVGALFALVPAILKIKYDSNEVVISIMMNYVLVLLGKYLLLHKMSDPSVTFNASSLLPESARLTTIIPGTQVSTGLIMAFVAVLIVHFFLYKTTRGYEIRMTGKNIEFAKYAGVSVVSTLIIAQMLGGALAGVGGTIELLGKYERFIWMASLGYGFDGMLVAVIAKGKPLLVIPSALFLSYIRIGSDIVGRTTDIPLEFVSVVQALVIMLVAAELFLTKYRHRLIVKESEVK